ncbi:MAG: hypothetical protein ACOYL9_10820 [Ilumatobacteraceae bacterium]
MPHSDAFYYAWWSRLTQRWSAGGQVSTSASGYLLTSPAGLIELSGFSPGDGPIANLSETLPGGPVVDIESVVQASGWCAVGTLDCSPALAAAPFTADVNGTGGQLFALAKVSLDAANDSYVLFIQANGVAINAVSLDFGSTAVDTATGTAVITYGKAPPPGTIVQLTVSLADGRTMLFPIGVD